jgi:hypothetical protein
MRHTRPGASRGPARRRTASACAGSVNDPASPPAMPSSAVPRTTRPCCGPSAAGGHR